MHRIRVTRRGRIVTELALEGAVSIGRTVQNVLRLPEESVSSEHARVELKEEGCFLTDLASRNGTVVDGERIDSGSSVELCGGERISVGSYEITYVPPNLTTELSIDDLGGPEWASDDILPAAHKRRNRSSERMLAVVALIVSVIALGTVVFSRIL